MELNPLDYTVTELNKLKLSKGRLLLAEPFMLDPNFKRSVVLLTEYDETNCFGFILNRPLDITVNDTLYDFPEFNAPVFMGGPVETDCLFFLHSQGDLIKDSNRIGDGLYLGGDFNQLKELIKSQQIFPNEVKFFLGYSGWDFHQLNSEVEQESWIITDADNISIKETYEHDLWNKTLKNMGNKYSILANFPEDPALN